MKHLSPGSPRREAAARLGRELRRAMDTRHVSKTSLASQVGMSPTTIWLYLAGENLPTLRNARRLADALLWPKLVVIAEEGRQGSCAACGRGFVNEGGAPKRFCSGVCRDRAANGRQAQLDARREAMETLHAELLRPGPVRKQVLGKALTALDTRPDIVAERRLAMYAGSVDAFCRACSGDTCGQPSCELRGVSPLPLAGPRQEAAVATPPLGRWGHPGAREAYGATMRAQWADPEKRPRHERGIRAAQAWRKEHPEEFAAAVSRGRRRTA